MRHLFVLTERTLPRFVLLSLLGRRPVFLFANSLFYFSGGLLERFGHWMSKRGYAASLSALSDDLPWVPSFPLEKNLTSDMYPIIAEKAHKFFEFSDSRLDEYAYPFRKAVTDYTVKIGDLTLLLEWIEKHIPNGAWKLYGAPPLNDVIYQAYLGKDIAEIGRSKLLAPRIFNLLNILGTALAGLIWLAGKVRLGDVPVKAYRLAADRISGDDVNNFRQIIDDPAELLIVDRNTAFAKILTPSNGPYESCLKEDTRIPLLVFFRLSKELFLDLGKVWRVLGKQDPSLFGNLSVLCAKRAVYGAFFHNFRVQYFFGRDDYSKDHIIRNQELRKIGGTSLGINHGLPINTIAPAWQEVDFDIYYAFGSFLYNRFLHKTWPPACTVKPVGSKNMRPEFRARIGNPRPRDIAFFPVVHGAFEENMRDVFAVARHFGDRRVFIKMKANRRSEHMKTYQRLMDEAPCNVVAYIDPNPYELLLSVSYSIAFTTLVAESLQFGAMTFTLDTDPTIKQLYYRNFPNLLVSGKDDIIARISAIETGQESYDFSQYNELIKMDGPDIFQVIRNDIGLPATI
ncbi:MAG: hypothetical protein HQ513_12220 [Rhodospirillales bacterium]|nr:hypothetical protein [Rhodospirillales bacterium]